MIARLVQATCEGCTKSAAAGRLAGRVRGQVGKVAKVRRGKGVEIAVLIVDEEGSA